MHAMARRNHIRFAIVLFPLLVFLLLSCATKSKITEPTILVDRNIVFSQHDGMDLKLDIAYHNRTSTPRPAIVFISGSGWGHWWGEAFDRHQYSDTITIAAERGYVGVTVDYRPTSILQDGVPKYRYPDQLVDVRSAVRWIRANAERYGIDTHRIGAVGWSSGGHLALMMALLGSRTLASETDNLDFSSEIQAVVSLAGPTELSRMHDESTYPGIPESIEELIGGTPEQFPERYRDASPCYHLTTSVPPILMFQGESDLEVPRNQAALFEELMAKAGSTVTVEYLSLLGHMINHYTNDKIYPFLDRVLGNARG